MQGDFFKIFYFGGAYTCRAFADIIRSVAGIRIFLGCVCCFYTHKSYISSESYQQGRKSRIQGLLACCNNADTALWRGALRNILFKKNEPEERSLYEGRAGKPRGFP